MSDEYRGPIPAGCRVPDAKPGPLTGGGWRWVRGAWAIDFDATGRPVAMVAWPPGLSSEVYFAAARRAIANALRQLVEVRETAFPVADGNELLRNEVPYDGYRKVTP